MEITTLGFVIALAILLIPTFYVLYSHNIDAGTKVLTAFVRMVVVMCLYGFVLHFLMLWDSIIIDIVFILLIMLIATAAAVDAAKVPFRVHFLPTTAGMLPTLVVAGVCIALCVCGLSGVRHVVRCLVPIIGLLALNVVKAVSEALSTYYTTLKNHNQLYYYMLGNGATRAEALTHFTRRAMIRSVIPCVRRMLTIGIYSSPVVVWTLVLYNINSLTAVYLQVLVVAASLFVSLFSIILSLIVARKYTFDDYGQLLTDEKKQQPAAKG